MASDAKLWMVMGICYVEATTARKAVDRALVGETRTGWLALDDLGGAYKPEPAEASDLEKMPTAGGWRPIETAPRDQTHILIAYKVTGGWRATSAYFRPIPKIWYCDVGVIEPSWWQPLPSTEGLA